MQIFNQDLPSTVNLVHELGSAAAALCRGINDSNRKSRRKEIKARLAEIAQIEKDEASVKALIRKYHSDLDAAAERHQEQCKPIQQELSGCNGDVEKRLQLQTALADANDTLETKVAEINRRIAAAELEANRLMALRSPKSTLERGLLDAGDPDKLLELQVARNGETWARRRLDTATVKVRDIEDTLSFAERPNTQTLSRRWDRHDGPKDEPELAPLRQKLKAAKAEFDAATAALSAAVMYANRLEKEIRSE